MDTPQSSGSSSMVERMLGAATLNPATFEEVEHDENATMQAAGVVALVAAAQALGRWGGPFAMGSAAGVALLGWLVWAGITYFVGTRLFGGTATWGELLRTLGFAHAPGILAALAFFPVLGSFLRLALMVWMLLAAIVALRQALDVTTGKAIATGVVGWLILAVLQAIL